MALARRNLPLLLLGGMLVVAAIVLLILDSRLTFFQDTFEFLMNRRNFSVDALLQPHNEHIVVIPVALEIVLLKLFGMTSAMPEYVVMTVALLVTATLLFFYVRRRLGPWLALMAAALLLFVGPAWQDLLWPFEIGFVGSMLFGLAMLLALDREDERGDLLACVFLAISIGFNSLGIPFALAAAIDVLQHRRGRGWRRAYLVVIPVALYAIWWLGWGHNAESHLGLENLLNSPRFMLESLAASLDSMLGLSTTSISSGVGTPEWGRPLALGLIGLVIYRQWRKPGFSPKLWPALAAMLGYWFLTALNFIPGREPTQSRYLYASVALVLMVLANLFEDVRFERRWLMLAGAITVAAVATNAVVLKEGGDQFHNQAVITKADLGAMDIARRTIDPHFALGPEIAGTPSLIDVEAEKYFAAVDEYGSPGYTPTELTTAPEPGPRQADLLLAQALPLSTAVELGGYDPAGGSENCASVPADGSVPEVKLSPGVTRIELAPGPHASFSLRRFTSGAYPVETAGAPGGSVTRLTVPRDEAPQPWFLHVQASQEARVCR